MDLKEMEKRRGWPWKKKNGFGEGGTSPPTVKLFDEQEVSRILEDQIRGQQEQMDSTLREVDEKYSEREKASSEKLDAVNKKLTTALAEITVKDNLVKQHIKVAEEAVIGWERADNEAAAFKVQLSEAIDKNLVMEDRVQHLDGALKEVLKQLRSSREEHEQRIHETILKKNQECDKLRVEMETKLAEASHVMAQTRTELIESRAENKALTHALQDRSRVLAEVNDTRARQETNMKVLQVRLEGMEKENINLKYDIHLVTKELDARMAEVEHVRRASESASRQQGEALKKVAKLDDECTRLRTLLRKSKLPNSGGVARLKQDVDGSGREITGKVSPRRRPLGRNHSAADHHHQEGGVQENVHSFLEEKDGAEKKTLNLEEETRMLKEALAKRNEELQNARIMCAKTASRLSSVEEELEALRLASKTLQVEKELFDASSLRNLTSKRDNSLNFELMDDFIEMERLAESESIAHSVAGSEHTSTVETTQIVFGGTDDSNHQLRIASLEEALTVKDRDLEAANKLCHDLSTKLAVAENQFVALQTRNTANEQSVIDLQDRLDSFLESNKADEEVAMAVRKLVHIVEALAQATGATSSTTTPAVGDAIGLSLHWQDATLDSSMVGLVQAANAFLESSGYVGVLKFVLELTATLDCILVISLTANEEVRKERDASAGERLVVSMELESARVQVSELEEELCRMRAEQAGVERKVAQMNRFPELESEIGQLRAEKNELENNMSEMDQHLVEANDRVEALRVRLSESEALVTELRAREAALEKEEKEEDLIERELLELSFPALGRVASMRAADAEMHHLHDKVAALEVELQGERRRHKEVVAKLEDMQEQIHRGVGRMDPLSRSFNYREGSEQHLQLALIEDDATKSARKEKEIAAAALAECQRTILALGKQLKVLGLQDQDLAVTDPASPDSIEKMTHTMEFLRSQADSAGEQPVSPAAAPPGTSLTWAPRSSPSSRPVHHHRATNGSGSFRNGLTPSTDGPLLSTSEQSDSSVPDLPSSPASPASPVRVLRSVRTIRGMKAASSPPNGDNSTKGEETSVDSRSTTASTFRRFYSRSQSETSMSSEHSNPGPV